MEVISHWHPNITINIVDDHTPWVKGSVPPPLDQCELQPPCASPVPVCHVGSGAPGHNSEGCTQGSRPRHQQHSGKSHKQNAHNLPTFFGGCHIHWCSGDPMGCESAGCQANSFPTMLPLWPGILKVGQPLPPQSPGSESSPETRVQAPFVGGLS